MVERRPEQKRAFSQEMVPLWYKEFALRIGTSASAAKVLYDVFDTHPSLNLVAGATAVVCFGASRVARNRMEEDVRHEVARVNPVEEAREAIKNEMRDLYVPRGIARVGGSFLPFVAEAPSPYMKIFLGTIAAGLVLDAEARMVRAGRNVVANLKRTNEGPHPLYDRAR